MVRNRGSSATVRKRKIASNEPSERRSSGDTKRTSKGASSTKLLDYESTNRRQISSSKKTTKHNRKNSMSSQQNRGKIDYRTSKLIKTHSIKGKIYSFIFNILFYTLVIGVLASSLMFAFSDKNDASIFGYRFYNVLTNSMVSDSSDSFQAGDMTLVKMEDGTQVQVGDIITYRVGDGSRYLTHRMTDRLTELNGVEGDYIVTQGDANDAKDPPFDASRVLGKVIFVIPRMGEFIEFIRGNVLLSLLVLGSVTAFFFVIKAYLFSPPQKKRKRKKVSTTV